MIRDVFGIDYKCFDCREEKREKRYLMEKSSLVCILNVTIVVSTAALTLTQVKRKTEERKLVVGNENNGKKAERNLL